MTACANGDAPASTLSYMDDHNRDDSASSRMLSRTEFEIVERRVERGDISGIKIKAQLSEVPSATWLTRFRGTSGIAIPAVWLHNAGGGPQFEGQTVELDISFPRERLAGYLHTFNQMFDEANNVSKMPDGVHAESPNQRRTEAARLISELDPR
jgi:hypothetical protein